MNTTIKASVGVFLSRILLRLLLHVLFIYLSVLVYFCFVSDVEMEHWDDRIGQFLHMKLPFYSLAWLTKQLTWIENVEQNFPFFLFSKFDFHIGLTFTRHKTRWQHNKTENKVEKWNFQNLTHRSREWESLKLFIGWKVEWRWISEWLTNFLLNFVSFQFDSMQPLLPTKIFKFFLFFQFSKMKLLFTLEIVQPYYTQSENEFAKTVADTKQRIRISNSNFIAGEQQTHLQQMLCVKEEEMGRMYSFSINIVCVSVSDNS